LILPSGVVDLRSTDLEFGNDKGVEQWVYLRVKLDIPDKAIISSAVMEFLVDELHTGQVLMRIGAEKTTNAQPYSQLQSNWNTRGKEGEHRFRSIPWDINDVWAVGTKIKTPDFSSVIQFVVNEPGWKSGNFLSLIFRPDPPGQPSRRTVDSILTTCTLTVKYTKASTNAAHNDDSESLNQQSPGDDKFFFCVHWFLYFCCFFDYYRC